MTPEKRDYINIHAAMLQASMGKCKRAQVGCVITKDGRIISSGYNGSVIFGQRCETLGCELKNRCQHSAHAEENAIAFAAKMGIALFGATLYVTTAPCYKCARLIIQSGIREVVFKDNYDRPEGGIDVNGIMLLMTGSVIVRQLDLSKHE